MAQDMAANGWRGDPIRVVRYKEQWYSLDNRRLTAAKIAGLEDVPVTMYDSPLDVSITRTWRDHYKTPNEGTMIDIVEYRRGPSLGIYIDMEGRVIFTTLGEVPPGLYAP
jgi:hypothetical protein